MVFTEDCIVIKFLLQNKGYSARRLIKEFPLKIWKNGGLKKLLKKLMTNRLLGCPATVGEEPRELMRTWKALQTASVYSFNFIITHNS